MLPNNKQTTGETVPPTLLVRFVQKILISKAFIALATLTLFVPTYVHAGFFSFLGKIADAQGKSEITKNSQTLVLSDPSVVVSAVMGGDDVDTTILSDDNVLSTEVGPMGTALDVEQYVPDSDQISLYTVKKGDTIKTVAELYNVTPNTIIWANNLSASPTLKEGQMLTILPVTGIRYTFKKGDNLKSIAKKYTADTSDIELFNGITTDTVIEPGTVIVIPNGEQETIAQVPVKNTTANTKTTSTNTKSNNAKYTGTGVYKLKSTGELDLSGPKSGDAVMRSARGEKTWGFNAPDQSGYYIFPVKGGIVTQSLHAFNGVDISAPKGTPVMAAADGIVIADSRGTYGGGYGTYLAIKHPNGTQTLYAHNTSNIVTVGQSVKQGQVIGYVGSTGNSTGPHSHFEIRGAKNPFTVKGSTGK